MLCYVVSMISMKGEIGVNFMKIHNFVSKQFAIFIVTRGNIVDRLPLACTEVT